MQMRVPYTVTKTNSKGVYKTARTDVQSDIANAMRQCFRMPCPMNGKLQKDRYASSIHFNSDEYNWMKVSLAIHRNKVQQRASVSPPFLIK